MKSEITLQNIKKRTFYTGIFRWKLKKLVYVSSKAYAKRSPVHVFSPDNNGSFGLPHKYFLEYQGYTNNIRYDNQYSCLDEYITLNSKKKLHKKIF